MSARAVPPALRIRLLPPAHSGAYLGVGLLRDAPALAALHNAAADSLARKHGRTPWPGRASERSVRFAMSRSVVYVARERGRVVATLTLSRRKPWAIDTAYFSASRAPLYLTAMAVRPDRQGRGVGRRCLRELPTLARDWGADAVRLDAYDTAAGAGGFYAACGFREVGRKVFRRAPLVFFEWLFPGA